jgi:hypothetical protein
MKMVFRLFLPAVLIALGIWLWFVLFPSPEKIIRKQLARLAHAVSFSSNESDLAKLAGAQGLAAFFSTNAQVNIDVPGYEQHTFADRDEITQAALASRAAVSSLTLKFPDMNVNVAPDKQSAIADVTVEANVAGEKDDIVQEMKFIFQKMGGQWLISRVETVRTLSILNFERPRFVFILTA